MNDRYQIKVRSDGSLYFYDLWDTKTNKILFAGADAKWELEDVCGYLNNQNQQIKSLETKMERIAWF